MPRLTLATRLDALRSQSGLSYGALAAGGRCGRGTGPAHPGAAGS